MPERPPIVYIFTRLSLNLPFLFPQSDTSVTLLCFATQPSVFPLNHLSIFLFTHSKICIHNCLLHSRILIHHLLQLSFRASLCGLPLIPEVQEVSLIVPQVSVLLTACSRHPHAQERSRRQLLYADTLPPHESLSIFWEMFITLSRTHLHLHHFLQT